MFEGLSQFKDHFYVTLTLGLVALFILRFVLLKAVHFFLRSSESKLSFQLLRKHYFPSLTIFLGLFLYDTLAFAYDLEVYDKFLDTAILLSLTWVIAKTIRVVVMIVNRKYDYINARDNIKERSIHTQAIFLEKVLVAMVWIVGVAFALLSYDQVKGLGTKLLASAGIASVVLGFAAQKGLANLIAGFTIAFTQPIRIDDVVIVEGEWGRIEEITMTYVVVKIWDKRRLVLPVTYFTQRPFQNWTRSSSELIGAVVFWADYNLDVERLREDIRPIIEESPYYDGQEWGLQVTDADKDGMQIRILVHAPDASDAWDFRCEIREKALALIQSTQPRALPRLRLEKEEAPKTEPQSV